MPENTHANINTLRGPSKFLRADPSRGLTGSDTDRIVRDGGDFGAGLIRGASLCTRGEALGHGLWLDREFIASVADSGAAAGDKGVKARFTHPNISGDGLGSFLGRFKAVHLNSDGTKAIGDLHFSQAAHRSPDGDLANYVMDLAESDPEAFAISIVFSSDFEAEDEFMAEHLNSDGKFQSPDSDNANNLCHARLSTLRAADVVDEPAANPDGLFHREQQFAADADSLLSYAAGLTDRKPDCVSLGVDPDRAKGFIQRFCEANGLELSKKENNMTLNEKPAAEAENQPTADQAETTDTNENPDGQAEEPKTEQETPPAQAEPAETPAGSDQLSNRDECKRFLTAFGPNGGQWYADGLSFADAQQKHIEQLNQENQQLRQQITAAAGEGESEALDVTPPDAKNTGKQAETNKFNGLNENQTRFAAGLKLPAAK